MLLATPDQMRRMDRAAIEELGVPGLVLMENAGAAVAREVLRLCQEQGLRRVHVYCGTGNNGGDGFVAARHLAAAGMEVTWEIAGDAEKVRGDAAVNLRMLRSLGVLAGRAPSGPAVLLDALLGTGASGAPQGVVADRIREMNARGDPIVAVDTPSGVDGSTGAVPGEAVRATATVTLGLPKPGLLLYPGASHVGRLVVDPIGMDWARTGVPLSLQWFTPCEARALVPERPRDAHKGHFGHVWIVGGSQGMSGAPALAAMAALRAGAGLVTAAVPRSIVPVAASYGPEFMTLPLPEEGGALSEDAARMLELAVASPAVVCLGPGMGRSAAAGAFLRAYLGACPLPVVVDADGLNALAGHPDITRQRTAMTILTPHPGECARLLDTDVPSIQADRIRSARRAASLYQCVVTLKGAGTVVCDGRANNNEEDLPCAIVTVGNPGMASGGSGDVLTGVVGALVAQGLDAFQAACLAVYLHGRAGDVAASGRGEHALTAGDILESLGEAFKELTR